jgi:hypothetical protein
MGEKDDEEDIDDELSIVGSRQEKGGEERRWPSEITRVSACLVGLRLPSFDLRLATFSE